MHGKPFTYREFFVKQWADYVTTHDDWSAIQATFINAQVRNARKMGLTAEQVAAMRTSSL
jgi:hypothetical protein